MQNLGWNRLIDIYCERVDFSFWAEPTNAASNIFLILAGVLGLWMYLPPHSPPRQKFWITLLSVNAIVIGIGSFLFHTLATYWAQLADVIPITIFMILFLIYALKNILNFSKQWTILWMLVFFVAGLALEILVPKSFLNGSAGYLHALAGLMIIGHLVRDSRPVVAKGFVWAIGLFLASLSFRSIDMAICESFPLGTHFLWHTLNGLLLLSCLRIVHLSELHRSQAELSLTS